MEEWINHLKSEQILRLNCSDLGAISGYNPWCDYDELFEKYLYQDLPELLEQDARNLGQSIVTVEQEVEQILCKVDKSERKRLNDIRATVANPEVLNNNAKAEELLRDIKSIVMDEKVTRRISKKELQLLEKECMGQVRKGYGVNCEDAALNRYEEYSGFKVTERNLKTIKMNIMPLPRSKSVSISAAAVQFNANAKAASNAEAVITEPVSATSFSNDSVTGLSNCGLFVQDCADKDSKPLCYIASQPKQPEYSQLHDDNSTEYVCDTAVVLVEERVGDITTSAQLTSETVQYNPCEEVKIVSSSSSGVHIGDRLHPNEPQSQKYTADAQKDQVVGIEGGDSIVNLLVEPADHMPTPCVLDSAESENSQTINTCDRVQSQVLESTSDALGPSNSAGGDLKEVDLPEQINYAESAVHKNPKNAFAAMMDAANKPSTVSLSSTGNSHAGGSGWGWGGVKRRRTNQGGGGSGAGGRGRRLGGSYSTGEKPSFVLVGRVDGISDQLDMRDEDCFKWKHLRVVVEMKSRVHRVSHTPSLHEQIQLVAYMIMLDCPCGDLVQAVAVKKPNKKHHHHHHRHHSKHPKESASVATLATEYWDIRDRETLLDQDRPSSSDISTAFTTCTADPRTGHGSGCVIDLTMDTDPTAPAVIAGQAAPNAGACSAEGNSRSTYMITGPGPGAVTMEGVCCPKGGGGGESIKKCKNEGNVEGNAERNGDGDGDGIESFHVTRIELYGEPYQHKRHWDEVVLPRIRCFREAVHCMRQDDGLRYRYLLSAPADKLIIIAELCPFLDLSQLSASMRSA